MGLCATLVAVTSITSEDKIGRKAAAMTVALVLAGRFGVEAGALESFDGGAAERAGGRLGSFGLGVIQ